MIMDFCIKVIYVNILMYKILYGNITYIITDRINTQFYSFVTVSGVFAFIDGPKIGADSSIANPACLFLQRNDNFI